MCVSTTNRPNESLRTEDSCHSLTFCCECSLGDDMGCGKTVQVMSLLAALFEKTGTGLDVQKIQRRQEQLKTQLQQRKREEDEALMQGRLLERSRSTALSTTQIQGLELPERWWPVLIVVPPTVLDNWKKEIAQFTHFSVACYSGTGKENALKQVACGMAEIMLTKRSMFQQAADFRELNSMPVKWKLVIIDEFHVFKVRRAGQLSERTTDCLCFYFCILSCFSRSFRVCTCQIVGKKFVCSKSSRNEIGASEFGSRYDWYAYAEQSRRTMEFDRSGGDRLSWGLVDVQV
jgi:hypothetical protein